MPEPQSITVRRNLLESVADKGSALADPSFRQSIEIRRTESGFADGWLRFKDASWKTQTVGRSLIELVAAMPECGSVRALGTRLTFRLRDEWVDALAGEFEKGCLASMQCMDVLRGKSFRVDFHGANTTKALHVGHLRNLAIGNGMSAALEAAGARVTRQSLASDIGRQMCEALAGYAMYREGEDPGRTGLKPDHLVGSCYAQYVTRMPDEASDAAQPDAPISRELCATEDLASEYLSRWRAGEAAVLERWKKLRSWVIEGHARTLDRLGVTIDLFMYESQWCDRWEKVIEEGLAKGLFQRSHAGRIFHETGLPDYPFMPLVRDDGFPTAHLRDFVCLGLHMRETAADIDGYVQYCGIEWETALRVCRKLLSRLRPGNFDSVHHVVHHGLVTLGGSKVKSSGSDRILIDDVLERVGRDKRLSTMAEQCEPRPDMDFLARLVTIGPFLSRPPETSIEFSAEEFLRQDRGPGWLLARAWCRAHAEFHGIGPRVGVGGIEARVRYAVLQSQYFRWSLKAAVASFDPSTLARYVVSLCRWYLSDERGNARLDAVMRTLLTAGLSSLGLLGRRRVDAVPLEH